MTEPSRERFLAQSEHWDRIRVAEDEWVEITEQEPTAIPHRSQQKQEADPEGEQVKGRGQ